MPSICRTCGGGRYIWQVLRR